MLLRLLIFIFLAVVVSRALKAWLGPSDKKHAMPRGQNVQSDGDMVQDPQCGIYFPRRDAITLRHHGETHLFCSEKCKQDFMAKHKDS